MTASGTINTSNPIPNVANRAHQAVDSAADKAVPVLDRAAAVAHRTIDKVVDSAIPATEWAKDNGQQLLNRSNEFAEQCGTYVRARPITAVAAALLVGYLFARVTR